MLKPINKHLALLGAFWRLGECVLLAGISLIDFAVSILGIVSAAAAGIVIVATMIFPGVASVISVVYYGPPGLIFELGLGFWLITKGIQAPDDADAAAPSRI